MFRSQPLHRAGVNFTGGGAASPTNPKKGRADKRTIIYIDRPSDTLTVDRNMHGSMTPDEP